MLQGKMMLIEVDRLLFKDPSISLQRLARHFGVDRHKIQYSIRESTGRLFSEYKKEKKIMRVREIVKGKKSVSVKEISTILKFRSSKAFSRFVKNMTGTTYRNIRSDISAGQV